MSSNFCSEHTKPILLSVMLPALMLTACSDSNDDTEVMGDPAAAVTDISMVPTMDDPQNDDRPGLIVTGLNGTFADQLTSPWFVDVFLFRNPMAGNDVGLAAVDLQQYEATRQVSTHVDFFYPDAG